VPDDKEVWLTTTAASSSFYARHGWEFARTSTKWPNEIYMEWFAGRIVASLLGQNLLVMKREVKAPVTQKFEF